MMRFFELTFQQQWLLLDLAGGMRTDHVGREIGELGSEGLRIAGELLKLGLVEIRGGWRDTRWYSLTERGWQSIGL